MCIHRIFAVSADRTTTRGPSCSQSQPAEQHCPRRRPWVRVWWSGNAALCSAESLRKSLSDPVDYDNFVDSEFSVESLDRLGPRQTTHRTHTARTGPPARGAARSGPPRPTHAQQQVNGASRHPSAHAASSASVCVVHMASFPANPRKHRLFRAKTPGEAAPASPPHAHSTHSTHRHPQAPAGTPAGTRPPPQPRFSSGQEDLRARLSDSVD